MKPTEARALIARLHHNGQEFLSPRTRDALEVAMAHLGGPPKRDQPLVAGFVGVLDLPTILYPGRGRGRGLWLPLIDDDNPQQSWDLALAFRPLLLESSAALSDDPFTALIRDLLGEGWSVDTPRSAQRIVLRCAQGGRIVMPADERLVAITTDISTHKAKWELQWGADENAFVAQLAPYAAAQHTPHRGNLAVIDPKGRPCTVNLGNLHDQCYSLTPKLRSMADFHAWRQEVGQRLLIELSQEADPRLSAERAAQHWEDLDGAATDAWHRWLRALPGMRRLELAITAFFANGGAVACPALAIQGRDGSYPVSRRTFLEESFDHVPELQRLCAPGLYIGWQQGILEYSTHRQVLPILEAPRYLLTRPPRGIRVNEFRWMTEENGRNPGDFEHNTLEFVARADHLEKTRILASGAILARSNPGSHDGIPAFGPWLLVDNPLSGSARDRFVIAPPSGHIAACWTPDVGLGEVTGYHAPIARPSEHAIAHYAAADIVLLSTTPR